MMEPPKPTVRPDAEAPPKKRAGRPKGSKNKKKTKKSAHSLQGSSLRPSVAESTCQEEFDMKHPKAALHTFAS